MKKLFIILYYIKIPNLKIEINENYTIQKRKKKIPFKLFDISISLEQD